MTVSSRFVALRGAILAAALAGLAGLVACAGIGPMSLTPTSSPSPKPTATLTPTPVPTVTMTPTAISTPTATATLTPTATLSGTHAAVASAHPTSTPTSLPTPDGVARLARVPILIYHHVAPPRPGDDAIRKDLTVSPAQFEAQLRFLKGNGYESISLDRLNRHLQRGEPLPDRPVVLTFDDGYDDNYPYSLPLLTHYGFEAAFFVMTQPIEEGREGYLTWPQVELMSRLGMDIEPHSYSHPDLRDKPTDFLVWEIVGPKEAIEARTGKTCRFFAYPSGGYDERVVQVLKSAGFWGAVTIEAGDMHSSEGIFALKRVRVRGGYTLEQFVSLLQWDW